MYHHVKKLMFTVRVDEPDPRFGNMLLEQFGGANGELAAAMQYSIQGLNCEDPERKDLLMDIGTEELSHLEVVGTLARLHLAPTKFDRVAAEADPLIAIAGGGDALRPAEHRDPYGVARAKADLERIYAWLDGELAGRTWAAGDSFTLADVAAVGALFYADWAHPIDARFATLKAYRARLLARPSVARVVDEARPYRAYFPLGAPDRD